MKKLAITIFVLITILLFGTTAYAVESYTSISPLPNTGVVDLDDPTGYFGNLFTIFIVIAASLAVIRLMTCGISYMMSESISVKGEARNCIVGVLGGLLLILFSVVGVQVINQDFGKIDFSFITTSLHETAVNSGSGSDSLMDVLNPFSGGPVAGSQVGYCYQTTTGWYFFSTTNDYCGTPSWTETECQSAEAAESGLISISCMLGLSTVVTSEMEITFTSSESTVVPGTPVTLTWNVTGAASCVDVGFETGTTLIDGAMSGTVSIDTSSAGTFSYTLSCLSPDGGTSMSESVSVTVDPSYSPPWWNPFD